MLSIIQDLRDKLEKEKQDRHDQLEKERQDHHKELDIEREACDKDVKLLSMQMDEERANRKEDMEALRRVSPHVRIRLLSS